MSFRRVLQKTKKPWYSRRNCPQDLEETLQTAHVVDVTTASDTSILGERARSMISGVA
jgi:hypothetical protein